MTLTFFNEDESSETQRTNNRVWFLGRWQRAPFPPAREFGERCKLPHKGPGRAEPRKFGIWCNMIPEESLQKCLIMCRSHQELRKAKTSRERKDTLAPVFFIKGRRGRLPLHCSYTLIAQKVAIFFLKNSKIASLMSYQRSDLRKILKHRAEI